MSKQKEEWREIKGYEGIYQVSNLGFVRSLRNNRNLIRTQPKILRPMKIKGGYLLVTLYKKSESKHFSVHRLVAQAFLPNPYNKPQVNHIDGQKENNNLNNLEWVEQTDNIKHAIDMKLIRQKGQDNPRAKFTNEQVRKIREEYIPNDKKYGMHALARKHNVSHSTISHIIHNKTFKDI